MKIGEEEYMNKKGFTLIELLIVIAIISILVGVAVPYYNDYIIESRKSVLQSNLATIRKAINQFRADNQRGPAMVNIKVNTASPSFIVNGLSDPFDELVNGPLQYINGAGWVRRANMKYLNSRPVLEDPITGATIATSSLILGTGSCYIAADKTFIIVDNNDPSPDWAYICSVGDGKWHNYDPNPFNSKHPDSETPATKFLDYCDIFVNE